MEGRGYSVSKKLEDFDPKGEGRNITITVGCQLLLDEEVTV